MQIIEVSQKKEQPNLPEKTEELTTYPQPQTQPSGQIN